MTFKLDYQAVRRLLPHSYPMLMLDGIEAYDARAGTLTAVKHVAQNDFFLQGHFPEYPIFPGVLTVESLAQASMVLLHLDHLVREETSEEELHARLEGFLPPYSVLAQSRIKHIAPIYPGHQLRLEIQRHKQEGTIHHFKVRALISGGELAARGSVAVARTIEELVAQRTHEADTGRAVVVPARPSEHASPSA